MFGKHTRQGLPWFQSYVNFASAGTGRSRNASRFSSTAARLTSRPVRGGILGLATLLVGGGLSVAYAEGDPAVPDPAAANTAAPDPNDALGVSVNTDITGLNYSEKADVVVHVQLKGLRDLTNPAPGQRAPVDVVAVLDNSGSMSGDPIELLKYTMQYMIDNLGPEDRLAVVTFNSSSHVEFPLTPMLPENKEGLKASVSAISTAGTTHLSDGLFTGIDQVPDKSAEGAAPRTTAVILFTDGQANGGITDTEQLVTATKARLANKPTLQINTFGYGDAEANMLTALAKANAGMFYLLRDREDIPLAYADCMGGLLSIVARKVRVRLSPQNGVVLKDLPGIEQLKNWTQVGNGNFYQGAAASYDVNIGDVCSEETKDVLISCTVPAAGAPEQFPQPIVRVEVYYDEAVSGVTERIADEAAITRVDGASVTNPDQAAIDDMRVQYDRLRVADGMARAQALADAGKLDEGRAVLQQTVNAVSPPTTNPDPNAAVPVPAPGAPASNVPTNAPAGIINGAMPDPASTTWSDPLRTILLASAAACLAGMVTSAVYNSWGKKMLASNQRSHLTQRSAGSLGSPAYSNSTKTRLMQGISKYIPPRLAPNLATNASRYTGQQKTVTRARNPKPSLWQRATGNVPQRKSYVSKTGRTAQRSSAPPTSTSTRSAPASSRASPAPSGRSSAPAASSRSAAPSSSAPANKSSWWSSNKGSSAPTSTPSSSASTSSRSSAPSSSSSSSGGGFSRSSTSNRSSSSGRSSSSSRRR